MAENVQLDLGADGTVAVPLRVVSGVRGVAVQIAVCLQSCVGHWPEDATRGMPWPEVAEESVPDVVVAGYVQRQLRLIPEITAVDEVTATRDDSILRIAVVVDVTTGDGVTTRIRVVSEAAVSGRAGSWSVLVLRSPGGLAP